jgi:hypothetical protein
VSVPDAETRAGLRASAARAAALNALTTIGGAELYALLDALEEAERRLGECEDAFEAAAARADELELMRQHEGWYERGEYRSGHAGAAGGGAGPGGEASTDTSPSWRDDPSVVPLSPGPTEDPTTDWSGQVGLADFTAGTYPACREHGAMLRMTSNNPAVYRCDACGAGAEVAR